MTENLINPTSSSAKSGSIFSFQLIFIGFKTKDCLKPLKEAFNRHLDKIEVNDFTVFVSAVFSLLLPHPHGKIPLQLSSDWPHWSNLLSGQIWLKQNCENGKFVWHLSSWFLHVSIFPAFSHPQWCICLHILTLRPINPLLCLLGLAHHWKYHGVLRTLFLSFPTSQL